MSPTDTLPLLERKARVFALFSDPTRLKILKILAKKPKTSVGEIAKEIKMSIACVSHHLQLLKDNQVAKCRRQGNSIYYCLLKDPLVKSLIKFI